MAILHQQVLPHQNHPSNSMKKTHHDASDDHHDAGASSDAESSTTSSSSTWSSSSTVVATTNDASSSSASSPAGKKSYKQQQQQQQHNIQNDNNKATKAPSRRRPRKHSHNNKKTSPTLPLPSPPRRTCYALDCEMVGVGFDGLDSILARVTLVGWDGMVVYDAYVTPTEPVVDYRTYVSGITSEILERHGQPFAKVRSDVQQLLRGMNGGDDEEEGDNDNDRAALLVGHALKNDLRALQLDHPWHLVRDTAKYPPYQQKTSSSCPRKAAPRKLADLARDKLGRNIQIPGQPHCPIEDAIAALDLYKAERKTWERVVEYNVRKTEEIVRRQQQEQQNLQLQQLPLEQPPQLPISPFPSAE